MRTGWVYITAAVFTVGACTSPTPADPPTLPEESSEADASAPMASVPPRFCEEFDPHQWEWFELEHNSVTSMTSRGGVSVDASSFPLPDSPAGRYNSLVEVCPNLLMTISASGEVLAIAPDSSRYASLPPLSPGGTGENVDNRGVQAGVPTFGFRDALIVRDTLFLSDAVVDDKAECVRVDIQSIPLVQWLVDGHGQPSTVFESPTCVSYTDSYRPSAPIKTHLGGALAYSLVADELYLSIGDLHLGVSSISQAASIGIDNTERDYALLLDDEAAISAVVAIRDPLGVGSARIFAKGLRNSLGMVVNEAGELWLSDHGPQGGDELNLIVETSDYGWPLTSEGSPYDRAEWPADSNQLPAPWLDINQADVPGTTPPAVSWSPAIAPTAVVDYSAGPAGVDEWSDTLILGSLRGEALIVVNLTDGEIDRLSMGTRLRDSIADYQGRLISVTDSNELLIVSSWAA